VGLRDFVTLWRDVSFTHQLTMTPLPRYVDT
jgi:hypothetical protein